MGRLAAGSCETLLPIGVKCMTAHAVRNICIFMCQVDVFRAMRTARINGLWTTRRKNTALGWQVKVRDIAHDGRKKPGSLKIQGRVALQQSFRIGMAGIEEYVIDRSVLNDLSGVHHHDFVAQLCNESEIVRYEHDGRVEFRLRFPKQMNDLRFHGNIERRRRFICNQQHRVHQQGHRNRSALAHPATELMRKLGNSLIGIRNADPTHQANRCAQLFLPRKFLPAIQNVGHLGLIAQYGNLGSDRVLKHHRHLLAAIISQL